MSSPADTPQPVATLNFAKRVLNVTHDRRAKQLADGQITQAQFDADLLAAGELLRLAQDQIIFGGPPLN